MNIDEVIESFERYIERVEAREHLMPKLTKWSLDLRDYLKSIKSQDQLLKKREEQLREQSQSIINNHKTYIDDLIGEGCIYCKNSEASEFFKVKELPNMVKIAGLYHSKDCDVVIAEEILKELQ